MYSPLHLSESFYKGICWSSIAPSRFVLFIAKWENASYAIFTDRTTWAQRFANSHLSLSLSLTPFLLSSFSQTHTLLYVSLSLSLSLTLSIIPSLYSPLSLNLSLSSPLSLKYLSLYHTFSLSLSLSLSLSISFLFQNITKFFTLSIPEFNITNIPTIKRLTLFLTFSCIKCSTIVNYISRVVVTRLSILSTLES